MTQRAALAFVWMVSQAYLSAHTAPGDDAAGAAAGALGCLGCSAFLMIPVVLLIVQIALLVWVAKDSKSRGMDNAVVWMIFVFLAPVIGLIVYMRLQVAAKCPHCGNP